MGRKRQIRFGFGINNANYIVIPTINGKRTWCPYYRVWYNMLKRCYSRYNDCPTYKETKVCSNWKYFTVFKLWMETQDWKGKQLDKDILGDGKLYSPETCCFVPTWLNNLLLDGGSRKTLLPLGVHFDKHTRKFRAKITKDNITKSLGRFDTPEEAHAVYREAKLKYVKNKMKSYEDQIIKQAVLNKAKILYTNSSN